MNKILFLILVFVITFALANKTVHSKLAELVPDYFSEGFPTLPANAVIALVASLLILVLSPGCKEGFFFEVTPNKPKCNKGYNGMNVDFEYTMPGSTTECT